MRLFLAILLAYSFLVLMVLSIFKAGKIADEETDRAIKEEIERWGA